MCSSHKQTDSGFSSHTDVELDKHHVEPLQVSEKSPGEESTRPDTSLCSVTAQLLERISSQAKHQPGDVGRLDQVYPGRNIQGHDEFWRNYISSSSGLDGLSSCIEEAQGPPGLNGLKKAAEEK